jgi:D-alanyl-D-alanine carboxypeptidase
MFPANRVAHRPLARLGVTALAALAVFGAACTPIAEAAENEAHGGSLQAGLNELVDEGGFPGALASFRDSDGRVRNHVAGVGDLTTGSPVPRDGQVRVGSATKMFTSVVVLQLAAEGRLDLDGTVEQYLPGLVRGEGIDGNGITVRQLLQHTSGLPEYTQIALDFFELQHRYLEPRELLDIAFAQPALFAPGTSWRYTNTNYVLAGLVVQKVTGRPISEEITRRVIKRAGLRHTYWPGVGEQVIRGAHPHGYTPADAEQPHVDISDMDPSWGWAAGQLVSTPSDINKFLAALMTGRLLAPAQLAQMKTAVTAPGFPENWQYGLGLIRIELSCGETAWGHGGDIPGYETRDAITDDGTAVTITVTALPTEAQGQHMPVDKVLDEALCG